MKNLFDYATKELSQDAFLRWLFENYDCENEKVRKVCKKLFDKFTEDDELDFYQIEKDSLKTLAQWKNIDISIWFTIKNKNYLIVIEDKTTSEEHKQLENYNKKIEAHLNWAKNNKEPIEKVYKVFYKTAEIHKKKENEKEDKEWDRIENAGWNIILDINRIYDIFKDIEKTGNEILDDYIEHVKYIYDVYNNYDKIDFKKWLYNNAIFMAYAQKQVKLEYVGCYNGIYVHASKRNNFKNFTTEILFEFRHWGIYAKILYWGNGDRNKLRNYMRKIDFSGCQYFKLSPYGYKRLAMIEKKASDSEKKYIFKDYVEFNRWVEGCISDYDCLVSKISDADFESVQ